MDSVLATHSCPKNEDPASQSIQHIAFEDMPKPQWCLIYTDYTGEEEIKPEEAVFEFGLAINFCPFCGQKLDAS